jgi:hypothetical protein
LTGNADDDDDGDLEDADSMDDFDYNNVMMWSFKTFLVTVFYLLVFIPVLIIKFISLISFLFICSLV